VQKYEKDLRMADCGWHNFATTMQKNTKRIYKSQCDECRITKNVVPLQPLLRDNSMKFKFNNQNKQNKWQQKSDCSAVVVRAMLSTAS
jgi:hypothetical protein